MLAIHALTAPVAARHPERPTSGHLKPEYFMVKHPAGGYGETLFSAGEQASLLPYFEIKVVPGEPLEGRVRGTTDGARRLLEVFRGGLKNTPGPDRFLFDIKVTCDLDQAISDDESFWPRILLLPGDFHRSCRGRRLFRLAPHDALIVGHQSRLPIPSREPPHRD
jgi:hypothetical protein